MCYYICSESISTEDKKPIALCLPNERSCEYVRPVARISSHRPLQDFKTDDTSMRLKTEPPLKSSPNLVCYTSSVPPAPAPAPAPLPSVSRSSRGPFVILTDHGGVKTMTWTDNLMAKPSANLGSRPPLQHTPSVLPHTSLRTNNPADSMDQAQKMSTAVDGLLSLRTNTLKHPNSTLSNPLTTLMSPLVHTSASSMQPRNPAIRQRKSPINMEKLWAGDVSQLPFTDDVMVRFFHFHKSIISYDILSFHKGKTATSIATDDVDEEEPLICMICEDRATGLHYGIITCEG